MEKKCRLCKITEQLKKSHIIPKLFSKYIKKESKTGYLRTPSNVNKREQDIPKIEFLCGRCEQKFSKYERKFSNNLLNTKKKLEIKEIETIINNDLEYNYFIISIAWRLLQNVFETDKELLKELTEAEKKFFRDKLECWRRSLYDENMDKIQETIIYLIPHNEENVIAEDFKLNGLESEVEFAFVYIKVPKYIFIVMVNGSFEELDNNMIGNFKFEKSNNINYPTPISDIFLEHHEKYLSGIKDLSSKQKKQILKDSNKNGIGKFV